MLSGVLLLSIPLAQAQSNGFFDGPHTDSGVDADGNGRYEYLLLDVRVNVTAAGDFTVIGMLWDSTETTFITSASTAFTSGVGLYVATLPFNGTHIFESDIDGPYKATLELWNDTAVIVDIDIHLTGPYSHVAFGPVIAFVPPHSDWGMDTDGNDYYNFLQVNASVNTSLPGFYMVFGMLGTFGTLMDMKIRVVNLTAGDHVLQLNFSGVGVFISGESGTYLATLLASTLIPGEQPGFVDTDTHTTGSYTFTDFEFGTLADLTVTVRNATSSAVVPNAELWLANETHRFLRQDQTNLTGSATFPAFEGDFVLAVGADGLQDEAVPITISGDTSFEVSLSDEKASENDVKIQLTDWETAALNFESRMYADNQTQRFMVDQFVGDGNLVVEPGEAQIWLEIFKGFIMFLNDTTGQFEVDDIAFDLVENSWTLDINMTGDVTASEPLVLSQTGEYTSKSPIPVQSVHKVMLSTTYDTADEKEVDTLTFPTGWVLQDFSGAPGVTVTGLNSNTVIVDPQVRPPGEPESATILLNATLDTTPPQITSASASPDPQEVFGDVTVTADITENAGIASVSVNITDPGGGTVGNFTMVAAGGDSYSYTAPFDKLGVFNFTVWAEDDVGLMDSSAGNFTVHDTTPPALGAPAVGPSPQEVGLNVDFAVQVTDNFLLDTVTIAIVDPDGNSVGNFTMALAGDNYTYSTSFSELGTFSYTIWATDSSGNLASAEGEFVVQDTVPPVANAVAPLSVEVGEEFSFDATGSTDNHRIVNYTWNFGDGTLGYGATPVHTYTEAGEYTVTLTVRDAAGNEATDTLIVTVQAVGILGISPILFWAIIGAILAIAVIVGILLWRRSK